MSSGNTEPPVICIVGSSRTGKTVLLEKLIPELNRRGFRVGTIKHNHHDFEMDRPGKDSWRHKHAGAAVTVISSPYKIGVVMDVDRDHSLEELARFMGNVDIILAEGYKGENMPKIEVLRSGRNRDPLLKEDEHLVALISDAPVDLDVPRFSSNDIRTLADFLITRLNPVSGMSTPHRKVAS